MVKKCENTRNSQGCGYFSIFSIYLDYYDINFEGRWPKLILNHNSVNSQQIWMLRGSKNSENSWEQSCQLRYTKTRGYTRAIPYMHPMSCFTSCLWGCSSIPGLPFT